MSDGQALAERPAARTRDDAGVFSARLAIATASVALLYGLARLTMHAAGALGDPYGLDYGEGVVWQQMRGIVAGRGYAPLRAFPVFVYEYPPLYHLVTAATARLLSLDELLAGRLVSFAATLAAVGLTGRLAMRAVPADEDRRVATAAGVMAALVFATLPSVLGWAALMRVDMLACALTLAGLLLAVRAVRAPGMAVAAGLVFCAAMFTKQTCLPAPAAAFAVLWLAHRRAAWLMAGSAIAAGLAGVAAAGGRDFLLHIVAYNMNRVVWAHGWMLAMVLAASVVTLAAGAIGARAAARRLDLARWRTLGRRLAADPSLATTALLLLTLLLKTLMLPAILKSGASDNYLIDWFAPIAALIGLGAVPVLRRAAGLRTAPSGVLMPLLLGLGLPVQMLDPPFAPPVRSAREDGELRGLIARIRASARPVVAEDDMVLLLRAGRPILWEPAIVAELTDAGLYDEGALVRAVRRGAIGFFVTSGDGNRTLYDQRFSPAVRHAIDLAYPRRERIGRFVLRLPREVAMPGSGR